MSHQEERLRLKGRLLEAAQKLKKLDIRFKANLRSVRVLFDPYAPPLDIPMLEAADGVKSMLEAWEEMASVTATIEALKKDLGE